jgi:hypothetical protein
MQLQRNAGQLTLIVNGHVRRGDGRPVPVRAEADGESWHRELHHSDTPVSPELTFSFAPGHAV